MDLLVSLVIKSFIAVIVLTAMIITALCAVIAIYLRIEECKKITYHTKLDKDNNIIIYQVNKHEEVIGKIKIDKSMIRDAVDAALKNEIQKVLDEEEK